MADLAPSPQDSGEVHGGLVRRLLTRGCEFTFFQAVWLLDRLSRGRAAVGERGPAADETICFRPDISLGFPGSDIQRITPLGHDVENADSRYRVDVTFFGLYGVATPLPLHYAIDILRRVDIAEQVLLEEQTPASAAGQPIAPGTGSTPDRDFLDILHHRLTSLFYRAWTKYRYHVTFDMPHRDVMTDYLLWLIGCNPDWDSHRLGVSPLRLIRYAGLLTQRPRSAAGLEGLLLDYWKDIPIRVVQFVGRWVALKPVDLCSVGMMNSRLGEDLTVGEEVYDICTAFNIAIGPVDWETYLRFVPDASGFSQTRALVRLYCNDPLLFTTEVTLQAGQVPELMVSCEESAGRLGYTTWVRTEEMPETSVTFDTPWPSVESLAA